MKKRLRLYRLLPILAILLLAAPATAAESVPAGQLHAAGQGGWHGTNYTPGYDSTHGESGLYQEGIYLGELLNRSPVLQIAYCAETRGELLPCGT